MEKTLLQLDLIYVKVNYVLANMSGYSFLDLSKRIEILNNYILKIKKSLVEKQDYVDIRDVIKVREFAKDIVVDPNYELKGHKIACLLFEVSILCKMVALDLVNEDFIELLTLTSNYLYECGKIINRQLMAI